MTTVSPTLLAIEVSEVFQKFDHTLTQWAQAYPLSVFPEPDLKKAHEVLTANGMTLDSISACNMRHVVTVLNKEYEPVRAEIERLTKSQAEEAEAARLWRLWVPYFRDVNKKPFNLAKDIWQYDRAALSSPEKS